MNTHPNYIDLIDGTKLKSARRRDGYIAFSPDISVSTGNFSKLRDEFPTIQFDSSNETEERRSIILERTGWKKEDFQGKLILECGCGAGPDTEILCALGASVVSVDLAGLDVAANNLRQQITEGKAFLVQADLGDLPFKSQVFDIVFCHRVIMHTPNPEHTLREILKYVSDDGLIFVHSYADTFFQVFRWKYFLLPLTRRLDPNFVFNTIKNNAKWLFKLSKLLFKFGKVGSYLNWVFVPFYNYSRKTTFESKSEEFLIEYGIHDTFDALTPKYDKPLKFQEAKKIVYERNLTRQTNFYQDRYITLIRSK